MGPYGQKFGKIATPQNLLKLCEPVGYKVSHHRAKYFGRALNRLTSRGQIDIQITWDPMGGGGAKFKSVR